jgi:hypothetical protein
MAARISDLFQTPSGDRLLISFRAFEALFFQVRCIPLALLCKNCTQTYCDQSHS